MIKIPNFGDALKEIRELLKFLANTEYNFRKDCALIATIVYLYLNNEKTNIEHKIEINNMLVTHSEAVKNWEQRYEGVMVLWKEDVKHFSKVFQDVQEESAKVKSETEKLKKSD